MGYGPHSLHRRLQNITNPRLCSRCGCPGMIGGREKPLFAKGRRVALLTCSTRHRGYGAWRDGGLTIHDISDPARPTLLSHINWSPPFPGGTHTALPLPDRGLAVVADEANAEQCAKGTFHTFVVDVRAPQKPVSISTLPTPKDRDLRAGHVRSAQPPREPAGQLRHGKPSSRRTTTRGERVDSGRIRAKESATGAATPRLIDPRPNLALGEVSRLYVTSMAHVPD